MDELGKSLYEIWVAKMDKQAITIDETWEELNSLDKQAWSDTADSFARLIVGAY